MIQISSQSVEPFILEIAEHRDIESQKYYIDYKNDLDIIIIFENIVFRIFQKI